MRTLSMRISSLRACSLHAKVWKCYWSGSGEEGEGAGGAPGSPTGETPPQHSRPGQGTSVSPLLAGRKFGRVTLKGRIKNLQPDKTAVKGCLAVFDKNARTRVFVFWGSCFKICITSYTQFSFLYWKKWRKSSFLQFCDCLITCYLWRLM